MRLGSALRQPTSKKNVACLNGSIDSAAHLNLSALRRIIARLLRQEICDIKGVAIVAMLFLLSQLSDVAQQNYDIFIAFSIEVF